MKFISWNIAGGHLLKESLKDSISYDSENLEYFINQLRIENAEVIALQESHTSSNPNEISQSKIIAEQLGYSFIANHPYGRSHIKDGQQLSLAILSKHPIINTKFHVIPNPNLSITRPNGDTWVSFDVGFLHCQIQYNEQLINVASGHMVPFHYFKRNFAELEFQKIRNAISDFCVELAQQPSIMGVDFNYQNIDTLLPEIFTKKLYSEAFTNITTTPGRGQQDHILLSQQWNVVRSEVQQTQSDHYLCVVEVK